MKLSGTRGYLVFLTLLLCGRIAVAQPQAANVLAGDVESGAVNWSEADGSGGWYAELLLTGQGRVLAHLDAVGSVQWARTFADAEGSPAPLVAKRIASNGDLIGATASHNPMGGELDSGYVQARVMRISPAGQVVWASTAVTEFWTVSSGWTWMGCALGTGDEVFVMAGLADDRNILFKFSADGQLLWTRWLRPGGVLASMFIESDGAGGCRVVFQQDGFADAFVVMRFDGQGVLLGSTRYTQLAQNGYVTIMSTCPAPDGGLLIAGRVQVIGMNSYFFLLRMDVEGEVLWYRYYLRNGLGPFSVDDGSVVMNDDGSIWMSDANGLLNVSDQGDGLAAFELAVLQTGDIQTSWLLEHISPGTAGSGIRMGGRMNQQDMVLGLARSLAFVSGLDPADPPCHMVPVGIETIDAITALDVAVDDATAELRFATVTTMGGTSTELDAWSLSDMCQLVSVAENGSRDRPLLLNPLGHVDEALVVVHLPSSEVRLRDAAGRLLYARSVHGTDRLELPIPSPEAGTYFLEVIEERGGAVHRAKAVRVR